MSSLNACSTSACMATCATFANTIAMPNRQSSNVACLGKRSIASSMFSKPSKPHSTSVSKSDLVKNPACHARIQTIQ